VHGHGQCSVCGLIVDGCCWGEREEENFLEPGKAEDEDFETGRD